MSNSLMWKLGLIVAVVALAALATFPPEDKINLGLDLRGGAHILIQVETESTLKYEMAAVQTDMARVFDDRAIPYESVLVEGTTVLVRGIEAARISAAREALGLLGWEVQSAGSGALSATMPPDRRQRLQVEAVETTLDTIRRRIDGLGVGEQLVQKQGIAGDRILVQLPGVEDPERVKGLIIDTESLDWKEVRYPPTAGSEPCSSGWRGAASREALLAEFGGALPADAEIFPETRPDGVTAYWPLKQVSVVRGPDLVDARVGYDQWSQPQINFELSQDAGKRFEEATKRNVGCVMAIVLGSTDHKYVFSAPSIESAIRDQGRIVGSYTQQEAEDFALKLRSGAIPTDLTFIEERTIGPSLGRDSIRSGVAAGVAGFLFVMLFILVYYRLAGLNAVVALALNMLLIFGVLGALPFLFPGAQATLTLPGIAGMILTVGMAVDSNVLIFERIREELSIGKTVRAAIDQGFSKAFLTIIDCNVTSLVAAFFLFSYGTGPVKGFAVTLTIGLLASIFTAVFVSRQLFEIVLLVKGRKAEHLSI